MFEGLDLRIAFVLLSLRRFTKAGDCPIKSAESNNENRRTAQVKQ